jgi:hypothetical protein
VYLAVLERVEPDRKLYIALGKSAYDELTGMETFELVVERFGVSLLIVRIADEEVDAWRN